MDDDHASSNSIFLTELKWFRVISINGISKIVKSYMNILALCIMFLMLSMKQQTAFLNALNPLGN
jgi:hypothetical protein